MYATEGGGEHQNARSVSVAYYIVYARKLGSASVFLTKFISKPARLRYRYSLTIVSIFAQVNITNPTT